MLTCGDIAPFRANALHALFPPSITDTAHDKPQPVPEEVRHPYSNRLTRVYLIKTHMHPIICVPSDVYRPPDSHAIVHETALGLVLWQSNE